MRCVTEKHLATYINFLWYSELAVVLFPRVNTLQLMTAKKQRDTQREVWPKKWESAMTACTDPQWSKSRDFSSQSSQTSKIWTHSTEVYVYIICTESVYTDIKTNSARLGWEFLDPRPRLQNASDPNLTELQADPQSWCYKSKIGHNFRMRGFPLKQYFSYNFCPLLE